MCQVLKSKGFVHCREFCGEPAIHYGRDNIIPQRGQDKHILGFLSWVQVKFLQLKGHIRREGVTFTGAWVETNFSITPSWEAHSIEVVSAIQNSVVRPGYCDQVSYFLSERLSKVIVFVNIFVSLF